MHISVYSNNDNNANNAPVAEAEASTTEQGEHVPALGGDSTSSGGGGALAPGHANSGSHGGGSGGVLAALFKKAGAPFKMKDCQNCRCKWCLDSGISGRCGIHLFVILFCVCACV